MLLCDMAIESVASENLSLLATISGRVARAPSFVQPPFLPFPLIPPTYADIGVVSGNPALSSEDVLSDTPLFAGAHMCIHSVRTGPGCLVPPT